MDLKQLQAIVALAEHRTFSAAAAHLHTVQSNVSAHVARLERELGATLFDRSAGQLTEEGLAVVERGRRIQAELEALRADVAALRSEVVGTARVGMIGTTARWLVPRLLAALDELHPGISLVVLEATSTSLEPQLVSGDLDVAVVNLPLPPGEDLVSEPLFDEDLLLVLPTDHPLAARDDVQPVDLDDLADLELLLPPKGTAFRGELDRACAARGITLRPKAELDGVRLVATLAFEGHGPAVLPATAIPSWLQGNWQAKPVRGMPRRRVGLAFRRRGRPAAPARAVTDVLREIAAPAFAGMSGLHPPAELP